MLLLSLSYRSSISYKDEFDMELNYNRSSQYSLAYHPIIENITLVWLFEKYSVRIILLSNKCVQIEAIQKQFLNHMI